jgi:hypothetical protein
MLEMIEMIDYTENLNQELSEAYEAFINDFTNDNRWSQNYETESADHE